MKADRSILTASLKRVALQGSFLLAATLSIPAFAGVDVRIDLGAPPPPRVETIPVAPAGYVWAPGYWDFFQGHYIWRRGHFMEGRPGYRWAPEVWERRGEVHHFNEGHWERDPDYHHDRGDRDHHH